MHTRQRRISIYFLILIFGLVAGLAYIGTTLLKGYLSARKTVGELSQNFKDGSIEIYANQGNVDPLALETVYRKHAVVNSISVYRGKNNILSGGNEPSLYLDKEGVRHYKHGWWQKIVRTHIPDPVNGQDLNVDMVVDVVPLDILKIGLLKGLALVSSIFVLNLIGSAIGRRRPEHKIRKQKKVAEEESEFNEVAKPIENTGSIQISKKPDQPLMSMDIPLETLLEPEALDEFFSTLDELDKKNAKEEAHKKAQEEAQRKIAYAKIRGEEIPEEWLVIANGELEDNADLAQPSELVEQEEEVLATTDFELPELPELASTDTTESVNEVDLAQPSELAEQEEEVLATTDFELPELPELASTDTTESVNEADLAQPSELAEQEEEVLATTDFELPELPELASTDTTESVNEADLAERTSSISALQDYTLEEPVIEQDEQTPSVAMDLTEDEEIELPFVADTQFLEKGTVSHKDDFDDLPNLGSLLNSGSVARKDDEEFDDLPDLDNLLRSEENREKWTTEIGNIEDTSVLDFKPEVLEEISSATDIGLRNLSQDLDDEFVYEDLSLDKSCNHPAYSIHKKLPEPLMLKSMKAKNTQFHPPKTYKVSENLRSTFTEEELEEALLNNRWTDALGKIILDAEQASEDFCLLVFSLNNRMAVDLARQFFSEVYGLALHHFSENSTGVWLIDTDLEEAYGVAGEFAYYIEQHKYGVSIGLSSRSQRLVEAEDLVREALHALLRCVYSNGGIVGFRPDPDKYARIKTAADG
ncbi:MAG: hypothetical protein ACRCVN_02650 [Spirochaetia bacterium]